MTREEYWKKNIFYLSILLSVWAIVSFVISIIFVDYFDSFKLGNFKLGYWFSQQGSIYSFVILIFVYVFLMNRLDKKLEINKDKGTLK